MPKDSRLIFDTGKELDRAAAVRADFDVNLEDPLESLRLTHCCPLPGQCPIFRGLPLTRLATSPAARRDDPGGVGNIGRKYPMESGQILARRGNERCQSSDEIERLEDHVSGPVMVA